LLVIVDVTYRQIQFGERFLYLLHCAHDFLRDLSFHLDPQFLGDCR